MVVVMLTEAPVARIDGDCIHIQSRSGKEQWEACIKRSDFRRYIEKSKIMLDDADREQAQIIELRGRDCCVGH